METIRFFDVETPNQYHDRICQIGMIETDLDGNVIREEEALINPETDFFFMNTKVHGLSKRDVADSPTFPEVWDSLFGDEPSLNLIAHNATYDLNVLSKTLYYYQIEIPRIMYSDTMEMAKAAVPALSKYRLDSVCRELGISLDKHHDALCDARCCKEVYWSIYGGTHAFRPYSPSVLDDDYRDKSSVELTPYQRLRKMAASVSADGVVTEREARSLISLITKSDSLMETEEAVEALALLYLCLEDGYIDAIESDHLVNYLSECL